MRVIDLTGKRFGRLVVTGRAGTRRGQVLWRCACDCGKKCEIVSLHLRDGRATSCGCYRREVTVKRFTTHGATGTKEYSVWQGMVRRCCSPSHPSFPKYGKRGITVCNRWRKSFASFLADMGNVPSGKTLDRKNNSLGYSKDNCRWATPKQQARNTRKTVWLQAFGERMPLAAWLEDPRCKSPRSALIQRIRAGWSHEDAISTPLVPPALRGAGHTASKVA